MLEVLQVMFLQHLYVCLVAGEVIFPDLTNFGQYRQFLERQSNIWLPEIAGLGGCLILSLAWTSSSLKLGHLLYPWKMWCSNKSIVVFDLPNMAQFDWRINLFGLLVGLKVVILKTFLGVGGTWFELGSSGGSSPVASSSSVLKVLTLKCFLKSREWVTSTQKVRC